MDTSSVARQLRGLIYDRIMAGVATPADKRRADELAESIKVPLPSSAKTLGDLDKIAKRAFNRMDKYDAALEYGSAEHELTKVPHLPVPRLHDPVEPWRMIEGEDEGEEWKKPRSNPLSKTKIGRFTVVYPKRKNPGHTIRQTPRDWRDAYNRARDAETEAQRRSPAGKMSAARRNAKTRYVMQGRAAVDRGEWRLTACPYAAGTWRAEAWKQGAWARQQELRKPRTNPGRLARLKAAAARARNRSLNDLLLGKCLAHPAKTRRLDREEERALAKVAVEEARIAKRKSNPPMSKAEAAALKRVLRRHGY
jgi:hypothetical protein